MAQEDFIKEGTTVFEDDDGMFNVDDYSEILENAIKSFVKCNFDPVPNELCIERMVSVLNEEFSYRFSLKYANIAKTVAETGESPLDILISMTHGIFRHNFWKMTEVEKLSYICNAKITEVSLGIPTENEQLAFITHSDFVCPLKTIITHLKYFHTIPSQTIQLVGVQISPSSIRFIQNPSRIVQLTAIKKNYHVYQYIKTPDPLVTEYMKKYHNLIENISAKSPRHSALDLEEVDYPLISQACFTWIDKNLTTIPDGIVIDDIVTQAIDDFFYNFDKFNGTQEDLDVFTNKHTIPKNFPVPEPDQITSWIVLAKLTRNFQISDTELFVYVRYWIKCFGDNGGSILQIMRNWDCDIKPSIGVQLLAVAHNVEEIKYIDNPSRIVQLTAVKKDPRAYDYIENPNPLVTEYMKKYHSSKLYESSTAEQDFEDYNKIALRAFIKLAKVYIEKPCMSITSTDILYAHLQYFIHEVRSLYPSYMFEAFQEIIQTGGDKRDFQELLDEVKFEYELACYETTRQNAPSEQDQIKFVKSSLAYLIYILEAGIIPSETVQLMAVTSDGRRLRQLISSLGEVSTSVQLMAVRQFPEGIQHIKNPTRMVQLAAVKQNPSVINFIKNPDPLVIEYFKKHSHLIESTFQELDKLARDAAVKYIQTFLSESDPLFTEMVEYYSKEIFRMDPKTGECEIPPPRQAMEYIIDTGKLPEYYTDLSNCTRSELQHELYLYKFWRDLDHNIKPSEELQIYLIKLDPDTLLSLLDRGWIISPSVQMLAVSKKPSLIADIPHPPRMAQLAAVKARPDVINLINNPDPLVIEYYKKHSKII